MGAAGRGWWVGARESFALERTEWLLWVAVLVVLVGDVALTVWGLSLDLVESNPIAAAAISRYGLLGMVGLKGLALGFGLWWWRVVPREYALLVPICLAVPWWIACVNNLMLLLVVIT